MMSFEEGLVLVGDIINYYKYQYSFYGKDTVDDIEQECRLAVWRAIKDYDENQGSFRSYASMWIQTYVYDYINRITGPVSISREARRKMKMISRCYDENPGISIDEVANLTGLSRNQVLEYQYGLRSESLDSYIDDEEKTTKGDLIEDSSDNSMYKMAMAVVDCLNGFLSEKDKTLIFGYYGIGCEKKTQKELALELGVTHQYVSRMIETIIIKIKPMIMDMLGIGI